MPPKRGGGGGGGGTGGTGGRGATIQTTTTTQTTTKMRVTTTITDNDATHTKFVSPDLDAKKSSGFDGGGNKGGGGGATPEPPPVVPSLEEEEDGKENNEEARREGATAMDEDPSTSPTTSAPAENVQIQARLMEMLKRNVKIGQASGVPGKDVPVDLIAKAFIKLGKSIGCEENEDVILDHRKNLEKRLNASKAS